MDTNKEKLEDYRSLVWKSLKAPLMLGILFGGIFFLCFYYLQYPKWENPMLMGLLMFVVVVYGFGLQQVIQSYKHLLGQEKRTGMKYKDRLNQPQDTWFFSRLGPYIVLLNRNDIRYITTIETINRAKRGQVLTYVCNYIDFTGEKQSFYLPHDEKEKKRFLIWYDQK